MVIVRLKNKSMREKHNNILMIVIISLIAGLFAGAVGEILTRNYLFENLYGIPLSSEWNLSSGGISQGNVVIEGAKKIVVEQNERVGQIIESSQRNIVGIFNKKEGMQNKNNTPTTTLDKIASGNFYDTGERVGQGLIMTSDGWILTDAFAGIEEDRVLDEYVVITKEREIKEIDKIIPTLENGYDFIHVKEAQALPVKGLAANNNIQGGETVLVLNWDNNNIVTRIIKNKNGQLIKSSEKRDWSLALLDDPGAYFAPGFIFDLNENAIGMVSEQGQIISAAGFKNQLQSLLEFQKVKSPLLGINYINLANVVLPAGKEKNGALIYPDQNGVAIVNGSPAHKAGLKQGDIILAINNQKINNNTDLSSVIQTKLPGDILNIIYERNGQELSTNIQLEELK